jgi:hypothetical protein
MMILEWKTQRVKGSSLTWMWLKMMMLVNGRMIMISNIRMQSFTGTIITIFWCNNDLYYIITWLNVLFDWGEPCTSSKFEWRQWGHCFGQFIT